MLLNSVSYAGYVDSDHFHQSEQNVKTHTDAKTGQFIRGASSFRKFISKKPDAEFPPEKGRYHLYVSYACPWGEASRNSGK